MIYVYAWIIDIMYIDYATHFAQHQVLIQSDDGIYADYVRTPPCDRNRTAGVQSDGVDVVLNHSSGAGSQISRQSWVCSC